MVIERHRKKIKKILSSPKYGVFMKHSYMLCCRKIINVKWLKTMCFLGGQTHGPALWCLSAVVWSRSNTQPLRPLGLVLLLCQVHTWCYKIKHLYWITLWINDRDSWDNLENVAFQDISWNIIYYILIKKAKLVWKKHQLIPSVGIFWIVLKPSLNKCSLAVCVAQFQQN